MIKSIDLAWLAGLIDGEGSFTVGVHKDPQRKRCLPIRPRIEICMYSGSGEWHKKVSQILDQLKITYHYVTYKANYRQNHVFKDSYSVIAIQGKGGIRKLSKILIPYLIVKKKQAKLFSTWPEKRLIWVNTHTGEVKKYWNNINEVINYLRKSRELNRAFRPSKWTADLVLEYFKNLT